MEMGIGIAEKDGKQLAQSLNELLSNYQVFYMNVRGFHWNIKGEKFFELHVKFEELYDDLILKIDEIAERILTLGHTPIHTFSEYLEHSTIKTAQNITGGRACVESILESFSILIPMQREILDLSGEADDEGTNALMSDYIREQEKLVWMYRAFMG
jgi:starvation-inducible DNA-binding protein